jgi:hypothetical protein
MIKEKARRSGLGLFGRELRTRPFRTIAWLFVEYAMFFAAVLLALLLWATRRPLAAIDDRFGLRLRERFVDVIARISPG